MKTAFVSGVIFASLLPATAPVQSAAGASPAEQCPNLLLHEPIVLYEISGATLLGPVDRTLTVYADGALKLSAASATGAGECLLGQTTPEVAQKLQQELVQAGAFDLCDDPRNVTDVPLNTLTLLRGAQDARAHTFSYWIGDGHYLAVDLTIEKFINAQFPEH